MASMLAVTDIGLGAIANADAGGFLVNLTSFKVSEVDVTGLSDADKINTTGMKGTPVFEGAVTAIEVVDTSAVKLTLTIPIDYPKTGKWTLRELGIFLDTGELFAYGALEPQYEKTNEYGLKIYSLVVAHRLGEVINVVVSQNNSLPAAASVRTLIPPEKTYQNAVVVLDSNANDYQDVSSASIAVKSGPGATQWSFIGYNRIYSGTIDNAVDDSTFILSPKKGGFWINDQEELIVQILSGDGSGYSRKVIYTKETNTFVSNEKPWPRLSANSTVAVWRSLKNQLPSRTNEMEDYLVLGIGENDWEQKVSSANGSKFTCKAFTGVITTGQITNSLLVGAADNTTFVFIDGKCLPLGSFSVASNVLTVSNNDGKIADVLVFIPEETDMGGMLAKFEATYELNGTTNRFYLPIVPDDDAWVVLYIDGKPVAKSEYDTEATSVVFNSNPQAGLLEIVMFATYETEYSYTDIKRYFYQAVEGGSLKFAIDPDTFESNRVIVHAGGKYYNMSEIEIGDDSITLLKAPEYVGGIASIDITVFSILDVSSTATVSGEDTGPVWADPAGRLGPPNKLVPKVLSYVSDGVKTDYTVYNVPRKTNIVVMINGKNYDPRKTSYTKRVKKYTFTTMVLDEAPAIGSKIDFICFTDVKDKGTATVCEVFNFTTTDSLTYEINPVSDSDAIMIVVDGLYVHKGLFHIIGNTTLNFLAIVKDLPVEVWYFKSVAHEGWRTEMYADFNVSDAINNYPMSHNVVREENTLLFLDAGYQYKGTYKVVEANDIQQVKYDTALVKDKYNLSLINVYFVSGTPLTRLLTREDGEAFMPRSGPYVGWDNLSYKLRNMLACPMTKLLGLLTGTTKAEFNKGTSDDKDLADKFGLQAVTKSLTMSVLPTAAYAGMGSGAILGAKMTFNVYKYLEIYLKEQLGSATFTIHTYEQNVKYFIDDIKLGSMTYEALARSQIPMMTYDTGIYINYPNALTGVTYPGVPLLTNFFDMAWSRDHVKLPSGFKAAGGQLVTQSATVIDDDSTQMHTYTHVISSSFDGKTYTVVWKRTYVVADHNQEYLFLVDGGGAPGYVQYFARLYAQWKYQDSDIAKCMYYNKVSAGVAAGATGDEQWCNWIVSIRSGSAGGNYPAVASYTAGLTFGVVVDNFNTDTGLCDLLIKMTSGTIGYSYFPAELLIKKIEIPVTYTMYPALSVNSDGTIEPMYSTDDLFGSCCWTDFTPAQVLDCGVAETAKKPTVKKVTTTAKQPILSGTYPYKFADSFSVSVAGTTFVNGVSPALSVDEDDWTLDLSLTTVSLSSGFYNIVASAVVGSDTLVDETVNEVYIQAVADTDPPPAPTVDTGTFSTITPVITGTFTANDTASLTVSINGWTYLLDSATATDSSATIRTLASAPLTASGNNWSLTMARDTANVLAYGSTYSVVATARDAAGNAATDANASEVTINELPTTTPAPTAAPPALKLVTNTYNYSTIVSSDSNGTPTAIQLNADTPQFGFVIRTVAGNVDVTLQTIEDSKPSTATGVWATWNGNSLSQAGGSNYVSEVEGASFMANMFTHYDVATSATVNMLSKGDTGTLRITLTYADNEYVWNLAVTQG